MTQGTELNNRFQEFSDLVRDRIIERNKVIRIGERVEHFYNSTSYLLKGRD